ncbi:hypothetical protein, partial [Enterococcus casseliflavus]|uniref:hypothetical protein n=1 Tax=Enterococcus casseliflavus TaxID=37734 RepID=UPI003D0E17E4
GFKHLHFNTLGEISFFSFQQLFYANRYRRAIARLFFCPPKWWVATIGRFGVSLVYQSRFLWVRRW